MSEPIRILQVFGALDRGGSESMVMNLYRNVDRTKVQFDFVKHTSASSAFDEEIKSLGGKIYCAPKFKFYNFFSYRKWWRVFFVNHPEYKIIHGHLFTIASIFFKEAHKYNRITIGHSHSAKAPIKSFKSILRLPFLLALSKHSDYCFACSEEAGKWLYKNRPFTVVKNAVDIRIFEYSIDGRNKIRNEFKIQGKFVLGNIGRLTIQKNQFFLIDVFKEIHKRNNNSVLIIIGTGELEKKLKDKVKNLDLSDSVIFTGPRCDIPDLLSAMDIFVFPSLWEGLPVTVIEAQAAGLPCFISDRVTKEVAISSQVHYIPLSKGIKPWIDKVCCSQNERKNVVSSIKNAGYDILENSKKIELFYYTVHNSSKTDIVF